MVFYYKDLDLPNTVSDLLIPILILISILLPILIYMGRSGDALAGSVVLAVVQIVAFIQNSRKHPL